MAIENQARYKTNINTYNRNYKENQKCLNKLPNP